MSFLPFSTQSDDSQDVIEVNFKDNHIHLEPTIIDNRPKSTTMVVDCIVILVVLCIINIIIYALVYYL